MRPVPALCLLLPLLWGPAHAGAQEQRLLRPLDVFDLEFASDPQISPDGTAIVYVRNAMDIMTDKPVSTLWTVSLDGDHRPLTTGNRRDQSPRWSPDGQRIAYVSSADGSAQVYMHWVDTGQTAKLTNLTRSPGALSWSPDGQWLAFSMHVPDKDAPFADLPARPEGAKWADPPTMITRLGYRSDGSGYTKPGFRQLFILSTDGGTPRQITQGDFHHRSTPVWTADSKSLIFSANRHTDWEYDRVNTEIYQVSIDTSAVTALTDRTGADNDPILLPGGRIAYTGFEDQELGYQPGRVSVMSPDGSERREVTSSLDRNPRSLAWSEHHKGVTFLFDDRGMTKVGLVQRGGEVRTLVSDVGGTTLGRPYASGGYSVAGNGTIAFTSSRSDRPADVSVRIADGTVRQLTSLNEDLLAARDLGHVEEITFNSSFDEREIQGWLVTPPGFSREQKYPLILEIHGGPFANYGPRFSAEMQLFAAAGYVVLFINPRGSTSYGKEFGNLIHHAYPGHDYDDLMSGITAVIKQGFVDPDQLYVTGGSGGGVLTSWIVGKTDRFRAAVVAKPVINWFSFALTADMYPYFCRYWFPGFPWDHRDQYMQRSPISLVGNVTTPTMLLTGEEDYRTPISESEQYYQALKLRKIDTALVRVPGASHGIAARPSHLIAKVAYILKWFEKHSGRDDAGENTAE